MKEKQINIINFVLGLVVLVVIFFVIKFSIEYLTNMASKTDAVVTVALITGCISILGVVVSKSLERSHDQKRYLYEKREKAYSNFVNIIYKFIASTKNGSYSQDEMLDDMIEFSKQLTLWGSNEVVKKWLNFRLSSVKGYTDGNQMLRDLESILVTIRNDMGHKKSELQDGSLLGFFINDYNDSEENQTS